VKTINQAASKIHRPTRILQYGEGNFLRAFVAYMIDVSNEKGVLNSGVQLVKPIPFGSLDLLRSQDGVYTVLLRGKVDGAVSVESRMITCVSGVVDAYEEYETYAALAGTPELRFIVSNTTEAGIVYDESDEIARMPPKSYPGKLTKFLYERYQAFHGAEDKGLIILPVELIDKNGATLREYCLKLSDLWKLPADFKSWLTNANTFCNTLVDRIVTGYPADEIETLEEELGYSDQLLVTGEPFALWVIESENPEAVAKELPLDQAGLPVIFTDNLQPYRERKVRILNGAHTASVPAAYLSGIDTVGELMKDQTMRRFLEQAVYDELVPMVPLPLDEVKAFADSVIERFENPFIRHHLLSIALNSVSKFKTRVLPTILETYKKTGEPPKTLCFSLAALIAFYSGEQSDGKLVGSRNGEAYNIIDDSAVLAFFAESKHLPSDQFAARLLKRTDFWGADLTKYNGFPETVAEALQSIRDHGMRTAVEKFLKRGSA